MPVHVIADTSAKLAGVRSVLERKHVVTSELLRGLNVQRSNVDALVVRADLRAIDGICALKQVLADLSRVEKRIFLVEDSAHLAISQAYALGATVVLAGPLHQARLLKEVANLMPGELSEEQGSAAAASSGEVALASMFTAVAGGAPIDIAATRNAGAKIAAAVEEHGLADWLKTVRRHHEGTYQHCLLVTGLAVAFGQQLGVSRADRQRLSFAGMLHDIGKARIPLAILEKPGPLDESELAVMRKHPQYGLDALGTVSGLPAEMLDMVVHHHEYLDGSGYPHGLSANEISDLVRIITIADVFGALIERRSYKPPLTGEAAYDALTRMGPKLDKDLVRAFRSVAKLGQ